MFTKLFGSWKSQRVITKLEQHPVHGIVLSHIRSILNDTSQGIGKHANLESQAKLTVEIIEDIERVLSAPDQIQAVRTRIVELMLECARYEVLITQPPSRFGGISGELKPHIPELAKLDERLEELFYGLNPTPTTFDEMWNAVMVRYWVMHLWMNAYNFVRTPLGDWNSDETKDWFLPCYTSLCIWEEYNFRQKLQLPSVVKGDEGGLSLRALMHSTWIQRAQEGHKHLRLAWEKSWTETFGEPSPYQNKAV